MINFIGQRSKSITFQVVCKANEYTDAEFKLIKKIKFWREINAHLKFAELENSTREKLNNHNIEGSIKNVRGYTGRYAGWRHHLVRLRLAMLHVFRK